MPSLARRAVAECLGAAFLLAAVVGSGIMAQRLSGGNGALALLCNTLPTGAILAVLILTFGPVSGAHFNPVVSVAAALRRELPAGVAAIFIAVQIAGGIFGVLVAHAMFELPLWQMSLTARTGPGQWFAEFIATFGTIADNLRVRGADACSDSLCRWPLHHGRLLVYRIHLLRQSCRHDCPFALQHLCRHRAVRRCRIYRGAIRRYACGNLARKLAVAVQINKMSKSGPIVRSTGSVAIFGGPYSNLEATRVFFDEMARHGISSDRIICTGDIIAYGADASATLATVRASGCHVIAGNVEENLAAGASDCGCGFEDGSTCDRLSAVWFAHAAAQLSPDNRAWMASLPRQIELAIGSYRFAVVHGGVDSINRLVFASTDAAIKRQQIDASGMDGVIGGHCGLPFTQSVGGRLWHNSGALGMPANDGTARVWYSIFRPAAAGVAIEHRALGYDQTSAAVKMRHIGLPEYAEALGSGIRVDADTLPPSEQRGRGVALEEGHVLWKLDQQQVDCRQLWPMNEQSTGG